ncbi:MAG: DUF1343 domain-containing protein [Sphingomonadales bacterium]|nr:DUF1343 domain-containing protein [Sphingomonadales bacterium]
MRWVCNLRIRLACLCFLFLVLESNAKVYPSAANTWPSWKRVLEGKRVGLVIHKSSMIGGRLMPEVLLESGVDVRMIFVPEHGLRVDFEAGATVGDHSDAVTGLPVVSLYGKRKGPEPTHTDSLDIIVFDLQDVGVRFYTYLSTLHYVMEACSRASITLLVLDRPNVNDYTVDGPVLDLAYKSFVGMHPIPVMHGMTMGELAKMIKGEGWAKGSNNLNLQVWKMENYQRGLRLQPPVPPSPNLRDSIALEWYPTLCFFEGCPVSVGRGTSSPFTLIGSPWMGIKDTCFIPGSIPGRAQSPLFMNQNCCGFSLEKFKKPRNQGISYEILLKVYKDFQKQHQSIGQEKNKTVRNDVFFNSFFDQLSGGSALRNALTKQHDANKIRSLFKPALDEFRRKRKPYLLYDDL